MSQAIYPCEFCDTQQAPQAKLVTLARQREGQWLIFENVPALVCPHCGHRYFSAEVLQQMEGILRSKPEHARSVEAWAVSLTPKVG